MNIRDQIQLAKKLEILGVDLIQTEGLSLISDKAVNYPEASVAFAFELIKSTGLLVGCTGITEDSIKTAFESGVSAVSADSSVVNFEAESAMRTEIMKLTGYIAHRNSIYNEIPTTTREIDSV